MTTELRLIGMGVPPYSARGLTQTLTPITQAVQMRRTVNASLVDISEPSFRKYASTINGDDQQPPAVEGKWPGMQLTVHCIAELVEETPTEEPTEESFERVAVPGSVRFDSGYTHYRPILTMMIMGFEVTRDEWGAAVSWTMALEEV